MSKRVDPDKVPKFNSVKSARNLSALLKKEVNVLSEELDRQLKMKRDSRRDEEFIKKIVDGCKREIRDPLLNKIKEIQDILKT